MPDPCTVTALLLVAAAMGGDASSSSLDRHLEKASFAKSSAVIESKLIDAEGDQNDFFGVAVDTDGTIAAVGSYLAGESETTGKVSIFQRDQLAWTKTATLTPADSVSTDFFGLSVALDGQTVVVGSKFNDNANGLNAGAAYVFVRTGKSWQQQAKLVAVDGEAHDNFGYAVAISGDFIAVGST